MSLLGQRLREARERKRFTQIQVQKHTGINNKTLSRYESGGTEPDIETLKLLADLYEVSIDWLTGYSNDPNSTYDYTKDPTVTPELKELLDLLAEMPLEERRDVINQARTYVAGKKALNRSTKD